MEEEATKRERESEQPPSEPLPRAIRPKRLALVLGGVFAIFLVGALGGPPIGKGLFAAWSALAGSRDDAHGEHGATQYYTCGMHPWVILPRPGNCPICGMKLVPLDPAKFSGQVSIDPVVVQNIGVRVEKVGGGSRGGSIRTVGIVDYDETRLGDVNLKVSGWIEKLHVNYLGQKVRKGQPLFSLYSPDLYAAEEEYLLAYRAQRGARGEESRQLLEAARTKLSYFDIGAQQIAALEQRGTPVKTMIIRSPYSGVVIEKHAVKGMKVTPGMTAYRIADLSRVWVMATLYEYQSQQVKVGQRATMTLSYVPGQALEGKVVYVYPYLDQRTRQVNVRLEFRNPKLALKPGMYATVVFDGIAASAGIVVPRAAVIDTGERQVAFVSLGEGRFEPRAVRMGGEAADGKVEILEGLKPGEMVVTSGQFLIDSEARMREALAKMMQGTPAAAAPETETETPGKPVVPALPPAADQALGTTLDGYLAIGAALASDTARDIGVSARKLAEALDAVMAVELPGQPHFWHQHAEARAARDQAQALAAAGTIDEARRTFASLSAELGKLVRATGVPPSYGKQIEELHCPMYPDDETGAVWLQAAGPVRNPYFGEAMLTCSDRRQPLPAGGGAQAAPAQP